MKLKTLLKSVAPTRISGSTDIAVQGLSLDSRKVRPGHLFVAIPGTQQDGAAFIEDAIARGASAVVAECEMRAAAGVTFVQVADARRAVALVAAGYHGHPADRLKTVGITGTNGKTTTAFMLREALATAGLNPGLLSTIAYDIGGRRIPAARTTPEAPLLQSMLADMVNEGCGVAVLEVSSHGLVQHRTSGMAFDAGVFTNLTGDHLDYHGTMARYFAAKALLFERMADQARDGTGVINADDEWGRKLLSHRPGPSSLVRFSLRDAAADVYADAVAHTETGSRFTACTPWGQSPVELGFLGDHNVSNALAALAVCGVLGQDVTRCAEAISALRLVPGRLETVRGPHPFRVYVDYAHTDDALRSVLTTIRETTPGRILLVFGCGGERDRSKRLRMGRVAAELADVVVLTADNPRKEDPDRILADIQAGFSANAPAPQVIADRGEAIADVLGQAREGDTVLIAGKGHETFQELANTTVPFSDCETAANRLEELYG